jgi:N-acetylmuramoyl-L-alanine amidase
MAGHSKSGGEWHPGGNTALLWRLCPGLCALCLLPFLIAQPDGKRMSFYTPQTSYTLPVADRAGSEYVGLLEALEPMGPVSAKLDGRKWKLKFRDLEAQFEAGKTKAKVHNKTVELPSPFIIENGRGLVPLPVLRGLLALFIPGPVDVHEAGRRAFIGATAIHYSARRLDAGKIAFTFSAPVNPVIATEAGKLRMVFTREPLQSDAQPLSFDDKSITSAAFAETNGAAEVTVSTAAPVLATFSDDRKTITVTPVAPAASSAEAPAPPAATPAAPTTATTAAKPRPRPLVIIDAAHGGTDRGATLTDKIAEKDVTLALARRLHHELALRGIESALLRDGDSTLPYDERARIANASGAPLYLSLHAAGGGSGVRFFTSMLSARTRKPLAFLPEATAQAAFVEASRTTVTAISTELLKRDISAVSLPANVPPLDRIASLAMAVEVAPRAGGSADDLNAAPYQQLVALALANAVAATQNRLLQEVAR